MPAAMLFIFALTLFVSASLLFLIEPMVGKMMLPLLGGTPAVWNTCMVFFQAILLAGYAFAHWSTKWLGARGQARLQMVVLCLVFVSVAVNALLFSGMLSPNEKLILGNEGNPIPVLLLVLTLSVGVPMFVISTSAPLLQRWFSSTDHPAARDPYFLYGASNLGSMLMLIAYVAVVEPNFTLKQQQLIWLLGYIILAGLVVVCAVLMWKARPAVELAGATGAANDAPVSPGSEAIRPDRRAVVTKRDRQAVKPVVTDAGPASLPVTLARRLRWVGLAIVPSSLMLGATTYMTTDIAAIPLLWVLPLMLYLMTFIFVFAYDSLIVFRATMWLGILGLIAIAALFLVPKYIADPTYLWIAWSVCLLAAVGSVGILYVDEIELLQSIVTVIGIAVLMGITIVIIAPLFIKHTQLLWIVRLGALVTLGLSSLLLYVRDSLLIHRVMIMIMPLMVLLLIFIMFSGIGSIGIEAKICLHLATMFVVSMVCHGELARDRPEPAKLTEFFLWMSVGGVLGGLFNALLAPNVFNSLAEYPLMMMVACLLLPPLGVGKSSSWARWMDLALGGIFLAVGVLLLALRFQNRDEIPDPDTLRQSPWKVSLVALAFGGMLGGIASYFGWGASPPAEGEPEEDHWVDRLLDIALPAALVVLVLGLFWGLPAEGVLGRVKGFAKMIGVDGDNFRLILTFGLPAVLCYTFVERSVRFGLGVGGILLAAAFCNFFLDPPLHQERSFFGVLRVEWDASRWHGYFYRFNRLVHGTTLHGKQLVDEELADLPLTYYHRTGPVGNVCNAYNKDPNRAIAVIGLGTGSMACYGLPGQTLDYYDIDPNVVDIAFDTNKYFTFVEDAANRGVDINMILGDARLTFKPGGSRPRLKPLFKRDDAPKPARTYSDKPLDADFKYGLIVVDAFSSDAIPVHLITREAVKIFFDRLYDDGVLLMHISNRHLDLQPVLANIADDLKVVGYHMSDDSEGYLGKTASHWVVLAKDTKHVAKLLNQPRWYNDSDQQTLVAASMWPSVGPALMTSTGLVYAFQGVTSEAGRWAAREEGTKGDMNLLRSDWVRLDQPSYLAERDALAQAEISEFQAQLAKVKESLDKAKAGVKEAEKPVLATQKELKELEETIKNTELKIRALGTDDKSGNLELSKLEKKKENLKAQELKQLGPLESAQSAKEWWETIEKRLNARIEKRENRIANTPEKQSRAKKVGVWTDDYSNIWSVLNQKRLPEEE